MLKSFYLKGCPDQTVVQSSASKVTSKVVKCERFIIKINLQCFKLGQESLIQSAQWLWNCSIEYSDQLPRSRPLEQ